MTKLNFYRGKLSKYDQSIHGDGLYFTTDTLEILHSGLSYAYTPSKKMVEDLIVGSIKDLYVDDQGNLSYSVITKDAGENLIVEAGFVLPLAKPGYKAENGSISGGQSGLMSATDKYNVDTLVSDENTEGSVKNIVREYMTWEDIE